MEKAAVSTSPYRSHGWLDTVAIGLAALCAVHCLLTPVLVIFLPIIATSFFVHTDFHLWMILLVLPTTGLAIFMGCRKHKDKWVAGLSTLGLGVLIFALITERMHAAPTAAAEEGTCATCAGCASTLAEGGGDPMLQAIVWVNVLGGLILASAHTRNWRLCRKRSACNDACC